MIKNCVVLTNEEVSNLKNGLSYLTNKIKERSYDDHDTSHMSTWANMLAIASDLQKIFN